MKRLLSLILVALCVLTLAQDKADRFTNGGATDGTRDPRTSYMEFVPNEIIVKFRDETAISTASKIKAAGISTVD